MGRYSTVPFESINVYASGERTTLRGTWVETLEKFSDMEIQDRLFYNE